MTEGNQHEPLSQLAGVDFPRGNYRMTSFITGTHMSFVYRAYDNSTRQSVAIKLLGNDRYLPRFTNEALMSYGLLYPNIATTIRYDLDGEQLSNGVTVRYIVMKYLNGKSLSQMLRDSGEPGVPFAGALDVVVQVASKIAPALDYIHQRGIVHRDIKPSNLLYHDGEPYLIDFGIAKRVSADVAAVGSANDMTHVDERPGTSNYMPPEQWLGDVTSGATDQYALAFTLYEVLSNRISPLQDAIEQNPTTRSGVATTDMQRRVTWQRAHINESPTSIRVYNPAVPDGVWEVLRRAMDKDERRRYPDILQFGRALTEAAAGFTVPAARPAAPPPTFDMEKTAVELDADEIRAQLAASRTATPQTGTGSTKIAPPPAPPPDDLKNTPLPLEPLPPRVPLANIPLAAPPPSAESPYAAIPTSAAPAQKRSPLFFLLGGVGALLLIGAAVFLLSQRGDEAVTPTPDVGAAVVTEAAATMTAAAERANTAATQAAATIAAALGGEAAATEAFEAANQSATSAAQALAAAFTPEATAAIDQGGTSTASAAATGTASAAATGTTSAAATGIANANAASAATVTANAAATSTASSADTATASAGATSTANAAATGTVNVAATGTANANAASAATVTANAAATSTANSAATSTANSADTATASAGATGTANAADTATASAAATGTVNAAATSTANAGATGTARDAVSAQAMSALQAANATRTAGAAATSTPSATATPSPTSTPSATATPSATSTASSAAPTKPPTFTPTPTRDPADVVSPTPFASPTKAPRQTTPTAVAALPTAAPIVPTTTPLLPTVGAPTGTPEATESRLLEMLSVRNTREAAAETAAPEPPLGETQASVPTATFAPSLAPSSTLLSTLVGAVSPTPTPTPGYGAATGQAAATAEPARSVITVVSGEVGQAMRNAPNGQFVRELPADAILDVRNASSDNQWVDVALEDGRSGWVPISAVSLLRDAPARSGAVVARVSPGTRLEVLGTSPDAAWLNVRLFNGQEGWMSAPLVSFSTPTAVPTATPTPDPNATVIVNRRPTVNWPPGTGLRIAIGGQSVWVRAQPSSRNDQIVTTLANNNPVTATGNFRWDGRQFWWEIRTQFGAVGWIEQSYLVPQ